MKTFTMKLCLLLAAAFACLWVLARVCVGAADLREEMHDLGLD